MSCGVLAPVCAASLQLSPSVGGGAQSQSQSLSLSLSLCVCSCSVCAECSGAGRQYARVVVCVGLCSYQMCVGVVFWLQYIMCMLQLCHLLGLAHTSAPQPEQSGAIV